MSDRLQEIEERWARATPGPWTTKRPRFICVLDEHYPKDKKCNRKTGLGWHVGAECVLEFARWEDGYNEVWADPEHMVAGMWDYEVGGIKEPQDARAIAAAPEDISWLIAEVKRLREAVDWWKNKAGEHRARANNLELELEGR